MIGLNDFRIRWSTYVISFQNRELHTYFLLQPSLSLQFVPKKRFAQALLALGFVPLDIPDKAKLYYQLEPSLSSTLDKSYDHTGSFEQARRKSPGIKHILSLPLAFFRLDCNSCNSQPDVLIPIKYFSLAGQSPPIRPIHWGLGSNS